MAVKSTAPPVAEPATSWENPLIPHKRLRELYIAMVELRLLEEHILTQKIPGREKASGRLPTHHREEGCLVSTVLSLRPGDLTSDSSDGTAIRFLRGTKLSVLLNRTPVPEKRSLARLPAPAEISVRMHLALGAAIASGSSKKGALAVAYIHAGELALQQWKPLLKLAAASAAPVLFVVLPLPKKIARSGQLSLIADTCGVPGIPVDASDPIALYRVAQESMLRIRAGGGPVLMECIPFQVPGEPSEPADPILRMQQLLLPRGVATEAWFEEVAARFAGRLKALGK